jgi:Arc/MetJ family transcription regulator
MASMANLTLVIDDQLLQAARIKALQENTSVNEICREAIAKYAGGTLNDGAARAARFTELTRQLESQPMEPYVWPGREAFYDEVLSERLRGGAPLAQTPAKPASKAAVARRRK